MYMSGLHGAYLKQTSPLYIYRVSNVKCKSVNIDPKTVDS